MRTIKRFRYSSLPHDARLSWFGRRIGVILLLTASVAMWAQTAPAASNAASTDDDTLVLSPFTVTTEKDTGYAATNTLAGTRLNSEIVNTPVALSVMTRDFLNDIGAIDTTSAMEYALNAGSDTTEATGNARTFNPFNYQVRGFVNATNARDYFGSPFLGESYNIDYIELDRGPNSVLFGVASPGGIVNSVIKRARPGQKITAVQLRVGSFDEHRGTVDVARTFGKNKNLAVRLNLLDHVSEGYYDFEAIRRHAATLAATWRPFESTTVRIELEHAEYFDARARPFPVGNRFRDWLAAGSVLHTVPTTRPAMTSATFAAGSSNGIFFFPQSTVGARPVTFSGNYFRTSTSASVRGGLGTDAPSILDTSIVPRNANLLGPNNGNTSNQNVAGLFVEQRVGRHLFLEGAYYHQQRDYLNRIPAAFNDNELYIEVSTNDPVFDPSTGRQTGYQPNGVSAASPKYIMHSTYQEVEYYQHQDDLRLTASYDLNLGKFGHHQLSGLVQHTLNRGDQVSRREANVAPDRQFANLTDTRNAIIRINYVDFGSSDTSLRGAQNARQTPVTGKLLGTPGVGVQSGLVNTAWAASQATVDSAIVATQSSFFKERLWFTGGIRHDTVKTKVPTGVRDPTTLEYLGVAYLQPYNPSVSDTTSSFGAAFHILPWLTVFGNHSDNFNVQTNGLLFGETGANAVAGNAKGKGRDLGIRSKLFDGKVNLSLGYYKTEQVDQLFFPAGTYGSAANAIWNAINLATPGQAHPLLTGQELQQVGGQGIEFELTANPTTNLRLTLNYTRVNKFGQTRAYNYVKGYFNKYKAQWLTPANAALPVGGTLGATVQDVWNTIQAQLATDMATNGREPFGFRPQSANAFARYDFRRGALKGFAIGGGVNWRGPMVLAYRYNDAKQQVRGYEQVFVNGLLSYEHRIFGKLDATFQLNVNNLFGFKDPFPRRVYWFDDAQGPSMTYQYPAQLRRWSLSTTVRF